jgi:hypothetical protein
MSAVKGWEGAIKYSNRVIAEAVGTGDNVEDTFDLDNPASDELGDVTDDETKIEVFLDGVLQATTAYTLDGDGGAGGAGQIVFTSPPGNLVVITANYYHYKVIGYIQSVNLDQDNDVTPVHEIGDRYPVELKEGNVTISLSLNRAWIDTSLISVAVHEISSARGWLASEEFDVDVYPKGTGSTNPLLTVRGKFNTHSLDFPQDSLLMETAEIVGKDITVTTVP